MINSSKILTVSYGTFSCTLEGFDDSFNTMKAIAEYFRDLAADDRYFGAEPPTPDAEMLARIAEREIERRVRAHADGGKIHLRAEEAPHAALTAAAPVAEAQTAAPPASAEAPAQDVAEAAPAPVARAEGLTAPMPPRVEDAEPVAEPAQVAEAEVEELAEAPEATEPEAVSKPSAETEDTPTLDSPVEEAEPEAEAVAEEAEAAEDAEAGDEAPVPEPVAEAEPAEAEPVEEETVAEAPDEEDAADTFADFAEDLSEITPVAQAEGDADYSDPDSVAAKLSRIRSVVSSTQESYVEEDFTEDEHAQDFLSATAADLDEVLAAEDAAEMQGRAQDVGDAPEMPDEAVADDDEDEGGDDVSSLIASVSAQSGAEAPESETADAEPPAVVRAEAEDEDDEDDGGSIGDTLAQLMADATPEEGSAEPESDEIASGDDLPMGARLVKMKRADVDTVLSPGGDAYDAADDDADNLFSDEDEEEMEGLLSPEEEAELQRELAAVEADFAPGEEAIDDEDDEEEEAYSEAEELFEDEDEEDAEHAAPVSAFAEQEEAFEEADEDEEEIAEFDDEPAAIDEDEDALDSALDDASAASARGVDRLQAVEQADDVSRIFDQADEHLDQPEASERRNAIQHLRAAVAATRADKNAGVDVPKGKDDSAYRSDLAEVVRPRRPQAGASRSARPVTERPAPLKLVAEQRIDTPRDPVTPRRITSSDLADMDGPSPNGDVSGSFADYVEEMGAGSLPELLEAAAAYMADVEGRPQFSRPMLMGKLKEVEGDSFSREDGLRSFGQLLRQGKIQKLKGGRFAVTDETEFRAPQRNVG